MWLGENNFMRLTIFKTTVILKSMVNLPSTMYVIISNET